MALTIIRRRKEWPLDQKMIEQQESQALAELDNLIQLLEAKLPANVEGPEGQRLVKALNQNMAEYFRQLEMALPIADIEALYYKLVKQE